MAERPVVYLVDGSSYVYRAFFAIRQQLATSNGLPTKAVFGFKNMLQKLIRDEQAQYLGVADTARLVDADQAGAHADRAGLVANGLRRIND